ncbi:MAG: MSMEG_0565 family glycosyltransferase, partial [Streptosporangiaceae bacterium]
VKPRGGVVHTLALAETLHAAGYPVRVIALGDPAAGFFRPVAAPLTVIQAPPSLPTLEERVFANVDTLTGALRPLAAEYPILHTQDCISARAACRVRDSAGAPGASKPGSRGPGSGAAPVVIRTVHHVDDFTSPSLIDCQRQAILEPDRILVVSAIWQEILADEYGTAAEVVHNGVDVARFHATDPALAGALRRRAGAADRPLILAVGGIEPRKGSDTLMQAVAALRRPGRNPVLAVVGGHSFQDYHEYRDRVLSSLPQLSLRLDDDVVLLGTVPDDELPGWYAAADVLAFPSTKEGWGLAVLEAMSAGLPVVTSDLPVFREYLRPGQDALMAPVNDAAALAAALAAVLDDRRLADGLRSAGRAVCARFTWASSAAEHQKIYAEAGLLTDSSGQIAG